MGAIASFGVRVVISALWLLIAIDHLFIEDNPVAFITSTIVNFTAIAIFFLVLYWIWDFRPLADHYENTKTKENSEGEEHQE